MVGTDGPQPQASGDEKSGPRIGPLAGILRRGAALSGLTLVLMQSISLAGTLLLARLLSPAEIGIYAAGTVLTGFLVMFADSGLRAAVIQREHDIEDAADTAFWATAASGLLISLLALAAAPIVATVFRNEVAGQICAITSGMLLMHALVNVPEGLLQRRFNFRGRLIVDPSRAIAYAAVSVGLAAAGFGVWSLVIGNYVSMAVWLIGMWTMARWRPGRGKPSLRLWRELARFGSPLLLQNIVDHIRAAGEATLVGRQLGETSLGHYRYGYRLGVLPAVAVIEIGSYVLFPAFSRLAGDADRLRRAFLRALRWIWFAAAPATALVLALGEPAVVVLLGERWRGAGGFLVAMAGYGAGMALHTVASEAIKGSGRSKLINWASATSLLLGIGLILALLPFGLVGVGLAISITEIALGLLMLGFARSVVGIPIGDLLRRLVPPVIASVVALAAVGPLEHLVVHSDQRGIAAGLGLLLAETVTLGVLYLAAMWVIDRRVITDLIGAARTWTNRRRSKAATTDN